MRTTIPRRQVVSAILLTALVAVAGFAWRSSRIGAGDLTVLRPPPDGSVLDVPDFGHAWVVVFENESEADVIGSPDAPYFNELARRYVSMEAYQGVAHPSQPNYIALVSGTTAGVVDNAPVTVDVPSIFDQLEGDARDWRVYAENVPPGCFTGEWAHDGRDGPGLYARKHNPAISFEAVQSDPSRCAKIQDLTAFQVAAADLEIVVPNMCHAGHDCPVAAADEWLRGFLRPVLASPEYRSGGVVFVLFEESAGTPENLVPAIVVSEGVQPGSRSTVPHSHYSLLRTLQEAWGLPCLADSCAANTLGEVFR